MTRLYVAATVGYLVMRRSVAPVLFGCVLGGAMFEDWKHPSRFAGIGALSFILTMGTLFLLGFLSVLLLRKKND